ncbi:MAG: fumarylacetoacetate hydrolase family protein [Ilumatobacteraceae bacterium]
MPLSRDEISELATRLAAARRDQVGFDPISSTVTFDLEDAYAIQRAGTELRLARGERVVGWKLGYTSLAMRAQMGIDQPNFGPLTDVMLLASDQSVSPGLIQPRVEPEIGLRLARPLSGEVGVDDVLAAVGEAFACLEVVDSVYPDYRFKMEDNTADGSSAAQVVVGPPLRRLDSLDAIDVVLRHDGVDIETATGSAASGHPATGVVWLVEQLARQDRWLHAGDIVITGGLTKAVRLDPGGHVEAVFDGETRVAVRRSIA